jgi:hypothetical protein
MHERAAHRDASTKVWDHLTIRAVYDARSKISGGPDSSASARSTAVQEGRR